MSNCYILRNTGKSKMKKFLKYMAIIFSVFLVDLISKVSLLHFLALKYGDVVYDPNVVCAKCHIEGIFVPWQYIIGSDFGISYLFNVIFVWNKGVSFSAFAGIMPIIISFLTAIIIAWLIYYLIKKASHWEKLPLAMIIGGALGNLVDRIRFGAVADFIHWHIGKLWAFPAIFNVADIFITFGVCLYLINFIRNRKRK